MKTDTTEKGLEAHITQHLCLVNAFEKNEKKMMMIFLAKKI